MYIQPFITIHGAITVETHFHKIVVYHRDHANLYGVGADLAQAMSNLNKLAAIFAADDCEERNKS